MNEEVECQGAAGADDEGADNALVESAGDARAAIAADDSADDHHQRLRPEDCARQNERDDGGAIDAGRQQRFERIHGMQAFHARQAERRQHQDADAAAEEATIDADGDLQQRHADGHDEWRDATLRHALAQPARRCAAEGEEHGGEQHEIGDQLREGFLRSM